MRPQATVDETEMGPIQELCGRVVDEKRPPALVDNRQTLLELLDEAAKRNLGSGWVWTEVGIATGHAPAIRRERGRTAERRRRHVEPVRLLNCGGLHGRPRIGPGAKNLVNTGILQRARSQHV